MTSTRTAHRRLARRSAFVATLALGAAALSGCLNADQQNVVKLVNHARGQKGVPAMSTDLKVSDKAQAWSQHMAKTGVLEHTGGGGALDPSGIDNWCAIGENVGRGGSLQAVHDAFMASDHHRENIEGNFKRIGTGVVKKGNTYWVTEIFVRSC
ncbi:MAG: hypothetical protein JWM47_2559 [Acidimicrobiales bacterium]|nr:hypothetical protein [Acidimicrobiales bacterium]